MATETRVSLLGSGLVIKVVSLRLSIVGRFNITGSKLFMSSDSLRRYIFHRLLSGSNRSENVPIVSEGPRNRIPPGLSA